MFATHAAFACDAGYYLNENNECAPCNTTAAYYCPGDDIRHRCPEIDDNFYQWAYDTYGFTYNSNQYKTYWTLGSHPLKTSVGYCLAYHDMQNDAARTIYFPVAYDSQSGLYRLASDIMYTMAKPGYYLKNPNRYNEGYFDAVAACTNAPANAHYTGVGTPDSRDGTVVDANDCPWECDAGYYDNNGTCTSCPTGYTSNAGATTENQCFITVAGGHYIGTAGQNSTNWGTCAAGYARAEHTVNYGSTSSCTQCTDATYTDTAGASSCTACPIVTGELASRATGGYRYYNPRGIHDTVTGCYAMLADDDNTGTYWTACYYNVTDGGYGGAHSSCDTKPEYVTACVAGYGSVLQYQIGGTGVEFASGKVCMQCPENTYSPEGATTCTACPTGLYAPAGMSNANQCGHILHVGDASVYLHSTKKTSPAVHVKIGNDIFYGNMTTADVVMHAGSTHKLKVNFGGTTYSIYDDTVTVP